MSGRIKIASLWQNTSKKDGSIYFAGTVDPECDIASVQPGYRLTIFPNGYKKTERHPDFILYAEPPQEQRAVPTKTASPKPSPKPAAQAAFNDDEIPF